MSGRRRREQSVSSTKPERGERKKKKTKSSVAKEVAVQREENSGVSDIFKPKPRQKFVEPTESIVLKPNIIKLLQQRIEIGEKVAETELQLISKSLAKQQDALKRTIILLKAKGILIGQRKKKLQFDFDNMNDSQFRSARSTIALRLSNIRDLNNRFFEITQDNGIDIELFKLAGRLLKSLNKEKSKFDKRLAESKEKQKDLELAEKIRLELRIEQLSDELDDIEDISKELEELVEPSDLDLDEPSEDPSEVLKRVDNALKYAEEELEFKIPDTGKRFASRLREASIKSRKGKEKVGLIPDISGIEDIEQFQVLDNQLQELEQEIETRLENDFGIAPVSYIDSSNLTGNIGVGRSLSNILGMGISDRQKFSSHVNSPVDPAGTFKESIRTQVQRQGSNSSLVKGLGSTFYSAPLNRAFSPMDIPGRQSTTGTFGNTVTSRAFGSTKMKRKSPYNRFVE